MLFMIIERFRDNDMVPVYRRVRDGGRMLPDGLEYIDSWSLLLDLQILARTIPAVLSGKGAN